MTGEHNVYNQKTRSLRLASVRSEGFDKARKTVAESDRPAILDETVYAGPGENHLSSASHHITYPQLQCRNVLYKNLDGNLILESRRFLVVAMHFGDRRNDTLSLHFLEAVAYTVEHVDAGLLHETDIIRMMGNSHPVTFVILYFMDIRFNHSDLYNSTDHAGTAMAQNTARKDNTFFLSCPLLPPQQPSTGGRRLRQKGRRGVGVSIKKYLYLFV